MEAEEKHEKVSRIYGKFAEKDPSALEPYITEKLRNLGIISLLSHLETEKTHQNPQEEAQYKCFLKI